MGSIVASFRVLPSDPEADINILKEAIRKALSDGISVRRIDEEPIAFGLVALHVDVAMPEGVAGEMDRIEERLQKVEGVSQIDTLMVRRLSTIPK